MTLLDLLAILVTSAAVYLPKALPLVIVGDRLPGAVRRWLEFVAPAVLAALVAPAILAPERTIAPIGWPLLPFVATFVVAVLTRRMLASVAAGLLALVAVVLLRG
jgi:branched-subunit amino acid transport protein